MRGDELALRNAAIVDALRRGENLYRVAEAAELRPATVRVIAMGGGVELSAGQRMRPDVDAVAPSKRVELASAESPVVVPRRPDAFARHLEAMDRRNRAVAAALRDPDRTFASVCAEFGLNEATVLTVGWAEHVWPGSRRPRTDERERRDRGVQADVAAGSGVDALVKRWGVSAAHVDTLARRAGLPLPARDSVRRPRRGSRKQRDARLVADLRAGMGVEQAAAKYSLSVRTIQIYAREHDVVLPRRTSAPRPPSERDTEVVRRALAGEGFSELARAFGMSRERVRQIVLAHGNLTAADLAAARAARKRLETEQQLHELATTELDLTCDDLAHRMGLPVSEVVMLLGTVEAARRAPVREEAQFDVDSALREMRRVYRLGRGKPLTGPAYDEHRRPFIVSSQSLLLRFGTWRAACEAANVTASEPRRREYVRQWSVEDCLDWVGAFLVEGSSVKASDFAVWLETRPAGPSVATVRHRCGVWGATLRAAAARVTSSGWTAPADAGVADGREPGSDDDAGPAAT